MVKQNSSEDRFQAVVVDLEQRWGISASDSDDEEHEVINEALTKTLGKHQKGRNILENIEEKREAMLATLREEIITLAEKLKSAEEGLEIGFVDFKSSGDKAFFDQSTSKTIKTAAQAATKNLEQQLRRLYCRYTILCDASIMGVLARDFVSGLRGKSPKAHNSVMGQDR